jgi:hypothetical protein
MTTGLIAFSSVIAYGLYRSKTESEAIMTKQVIKCSCGDGFVIAKTDRGEWCSFVRWDANYGLWMNEHQGHGGIELEIEREA